MNMPEHDPQPGAGAALDLGDLRRRCTSRRPPSPSASIRSTLRPLKFSGLHRPPDTKTVGMLSRMAAISMPGVILSQFEMQTSASTLWAVAMYSTLSAMISREGSE